MIANCILLSLLTTTLVFGEDFHTNNLPLRGTATYSYYMFTVYHAKLFCPSEVKDVKNTLGKIPLRLELTYTRELKKKDFIESGASFMKDNEDIPFDTVQAANDRMNALYDDVKPGDTYAIEYLPSGAENQEGETNLYLNGKFKGTVPGEKFGASFLGIWLSKYSLKESFTDELVQPISLPAQ